MPLIVAVFLLGIVLGTRWKGMNASDALFGHEGSRSATSPDAAQDFWSSFLGGERAPVLGYADAVYLVDGAEDLFRFRRGASDSTGTVVEPHLAQQFASSPELVAKAGPLYYEDGNTGTGDLESVFVLTRLFTQMGVNMMVKRCRLITIDDLRQHDVILLGSPEENDAVAQLSQPSDFVWNRLNVPGPWKGEYVNRHPQRKRVVRNGAGPEHPRSEDRLWVDHDPAGCHTGSTHRNLGRTRYVWSGRYSAVYDVTFADGGIADAGAIA